MKEGLERFGEKAMAAVITEYGKLDDKTIFDGLFADKLSFKQKRDALNLITLVKKTMWKNQGQGMCRWAQKKKIPTKRRCCFSYSTDGKFNVKSSNRLIRGA